MTDYFLILILIVSIVSIVINALAVTRLSVFLVENKNKTKELESKLDMISAVDENLQKLNSSLSNNKTSSSKLTETLEQNILLTNKNKVLESKHKEYKQFFSLMIDTLNEDTVFLRSDLFRRFGEVPEFSAINSQMISFENKINQIKITLKELKMMEDYDD
jgi:hypothetical protein